VAKKGKEGRYAKDFRRLDTRQRAGRARKDSVAFKILGRVVRIEERGGVLRSGQRRKVAVCCNGREIGLTNNHGLWSREYVV
jgi:hypothetical protein